MTKPLALPDLDRAQVQKAYARWAPLYDVICGPIFETGRHAAAAAAREVGGRILEIGVGTGLSFPDYDATTKVTAIDISEPMVAKARLRARLSPRLGLRPEFPCSRLVAWARSHGAELIERRPVKPFGIYTLVRFWWCDEGRAVAGA
jgi:SAM-dependent methyltransferase